MKQILLTQGKYALVDDSDFEWLSQWKWYFHHEGYAVRSQYVNKINGKQKTKVLSMHRLILNTLDGLETDHINRDRLDNRRNNLRVATRQENQRNKSIYKNSISGSVGISFKKAIHKWRAYVYKNGKQIHLGYFNSKKQAQLVLE